MTDHETKVCSSYINSITSDNMYVTVNDKTGNFSITPSKPIKMDDNDVKRIIDEYIYYIVLMVIQNV